MSVEVIPVRWHEAADYWQSYFRPSQASNWGKSQAAQPASWKETSLAAETFDPEWDLASYGIEGCLSRPYHMASVVRPQLAFGMTKCHQAASGWPQSCCLWGGWLAPDEAGRFVQEAIRRYCSVGCWPVGRSCSHHDMAQLQLMPSRFAGLDMQILTWRWTIIAWRGCGRWQNP